MDRVLFFASAIFFALAMPGGVSILSALFILAVALGFGLPKGRVVPLSSISTGTHVMAGVFVLLSIVVTYVDLSVISLAACLLSYPFVVQVIEQVRKIFVRREVSVKCGDVRMSRMEYIVAACTSVVVMFFVTTSSPLYKFNSWDDANCFFTLGRGIVGGLVPYRDVYEQKGPYLYFVHALAALVSDSSFVGVYLLEVVALFVFLVFAWKTIRLFYTPTRSAVALMPLFAVLTYSVGAFYYGDSAEELCFPLLSIVIYIACRAELKGGLPSLKETFVIGLISGFLFFLKYTFCALVLGYILYVVVAAFVRKSAKALPAYIGVFLGGVAVCSVPVVLYFGIHGALDDLFTVYFYNNIFLYTDNDRGSLLGAIRTTLYIFSYTMRANSLLCYMLGIGVVAVMCMRRRIRVLVGVMFAVLWMSVYLPHVHMFYYCLILSCFVVFGWLLCCMAFDYGCKLVRMLMPRYSFAPVVVVLACCFGGLFGHVNMSYLALSEADYPQMEFARIIGETPDARILTYDVMDSGFYTAADVLPCTEHYCFLNINSHIPEFVEEQDSLIRSGEFDYIITCSDEYEWSNYEIVCSQDQYAFYYDEYGDKLNVIDNTFYLYKRV
ncbi:MAG: glycosyltransferase family 39 protein [Saccharofermentans sp.]|nr:glycosyltransferase family 39 protein [Saccharofermentans sp.]